MADQATKDIFDLTGRIALITGASRGIGEAIAKEMARRGAHVIVSSRKIEGCNAVADAIRSEGGSSEALACHVGDMQDIKSTFAAIKENHGGLDVLVNNAATNPHYDHILETDIGVFNKIVDVNIRGYFFMSIEAGRIMREKGKGVIINTASVNALQPGARQGMYSISKAAIVNMTRAFAKECGPMGLRVNALLPGLTKTKFAGPVFEDDNASAEALGKIPLGRAAEPNEMAGAVVYLASEAGSYTNGECIVVDGGMTI